MKQIVVDGFGDVSHLHVLEGPEPTPAAGEVVVEVHACGINYSDLLQREGSYVGGPKPPYIAGVEASGVVIAHGASVTAPAIGARVIVVGRHLHAERIAVPAASCISLPSQLGFADGAAFLISFLTAYHALTTVARARDGEVVVIHAAAGGVGSAAVQIAKLLGLVVIATASTEPKRTKALALGADHAVGYEVFAATARDHGGAAIILESVGGDVFRTSLGALAPLGRLVVIGASGRDPRPVDTVKLLMKSQAVLGLHLDAIFGRRDLLEPSIVWLLDRVIAAQLAIQVGHTLGFAEVRHAHELLASRASTGKIVLVL